MSKVMIDFLFLVKIPTPEQLGFSISSWRSGQEEMIHRISLSVKRAKAICMPTGGGKSHPLIAAALISSVPTCIVTQSKGLQSQYMDAFKGIGMVDIRGRNNYTCAMREDYSCEEGHNARCPYKGTVACPSSQAEMRAATSNLVVTNYSKWCASKKYGQGMAHFKQVIFDEGHAAPEALAASMQVVLHHREIEKDLKLDFLAGSAAAQFSQWKPWALRAKLIADQQLIIAKARIAGLANPKSSWVKHVAHMQNLTRRLATLAAANAQEWIVEEIPSEGFKFDPLRPGRYAEAGLLFRIPSIIIASATLRPKTMFMMGIGKDNFDFKEFDSDFDAKRCPIYYIPTMRVDGRATDMSPLWLKLDQIAGRRRDRKGIVHTVSYARRDDILATSRFASSMILNEKGSPTTETVELFKQSAPGTMLVSPSVDTGYDFPGDECEFQFLCKIPFEPPSRILKAREELDKEYRAYQAMQTMVQAFGRGMRCFDSETEILTTKGWKTKDEIVAGDIAYGIPNTAYTQKKQLTGGCIPLALNKINRIIYIESAEPMLSIKAKALDVMITADHTVIYKRRVTNTHTIVNRKSYGTYKHKKQYMVRGSGITKCRADELPARFKLLVSGCIDTKGCRLGGSLTACNLWFKLIGLIVSEGWISEDSCKLTITQSKPNNIKIIQDLFLSLGLVPREYLEPTKGTEMSVGNGKKYIRNHEKYSWVFDGFDGARIRDVLFSGTIRRQSRTKQYRKSSHKGSKGNRVDGWKKVERVVPDWVLTKGSSTQLRHLVYGMLLGDGSWSGNSGRYYTSEIKIANQFQAVSVLCGFRTSTRERRGQIEISVSDEALVDCSQKNIKQVGPTLPWCLNTELGSVVIRRRGKTAILGNSKSDKCESFIGDEHLSWFMPRYGHLAPSSFHKFFREIQVLPSPPEKLNAV